MENIHKINLKCCNNTVVYCRFIDAKKNVYAGK